MDRDAQMSKIVECALHGEMTRGNGGFVLLGVSTGISYMLIDEIESEELRESLRDQLSEDGVHYVYVVEEQERTMHIWKIDRAKLVVTTT